LNLSSNANLNNLSDKFEYFGCAPRKFLVFGNRNIFWKTENVAIAMYLDKILGSKTKVNVLSVLVGILREVSLKMSWQKKRAQRSLRLIGR
jgi:hypothetical protein